MISVRRSSPYVDLTDFTLVDDDLHEETLAVQNRPQPLDGLQQLRELVENLLALEPGETLQLHVENRLRLHLRQAKAAIRPSRASGTVFDPRISVMTASR